MIQFKTSIFRSGMAASLLALVGTLGCSDTIPTPPLSLNGPTAVAIATGRVCLNFSVADRISTPIFGACEEDEASAIGLVVNENSDRLTFIGLDTPEPRLADLTQGRPGVTHLGVGRLPVDVEASPDGTVAYTLNQIDRDISVVNLWGPEALDARIALDDTPIAFAVSTLGGPEHTITVAQGSPSRLVFLDGVLCEPDGCSDLPQTQESLDLPGTVTGLDVTPDGTRAFVSFRDLDYVVVVDMLNLRISNIVGALSSCSDGVDNDGDGRIDQDDPQCFGPYGSELGQAAGEASGDCQDGVDNDADGLIDRDDPDCTSPNGFESGSVVGGTLTSVCNDGIDNDGDGLTDFPEDPACYGPYGKSEVELRHFGFDAISIDELGKFAYLVDRNRNQVVILDVEREVLVDAAASVEPSAKEFTDLVGVPVFPRPLDVTGTVRRDCLREDNIGVRCTASFFDGTDTVPGYSLDEIVVRYAYGAFVSEDTGRVRYIETMDTFCRLPTSEAKKLLESDFTDLTKLSQSEEIRCTFIPEFPLQAREDFAGTCEASCDDCEDDSILEKRYFCRENTELIINPRFGLVDIAGAEGRISGKGNCEIPEDVDAQLRSFAGVPGAPREQGCLSPLLPQPLSLDATGINPTVLPRLEAFARADLLAYEQAFFRVGSDDERRFLELGSTARIFDSRLFPEDWSVTFEGALPATRRSDGLFGSEVGSVEVDLEAMDVSVLSAGYDLCAAGVLEGDLVSILSQPAEGCAQFVGDEGFLTYRVQSMTSRVMYLEPAGEGFASALPTRDCFPTGVSYEVRPEDSWVVVGERSGLLSEREDRLGVCVDRPENQDPFTPSRQSRVKTGETYSGPYLAFYMYPGGQMGTEEDPLMIRPTRGLSFNFEVVPNFSSRSFQTEGVFPTKVVAYQQGPYYRVLSTDANSNFVFIKDARSSSEFGIRLR